MLLKETNRMVIKAMRDMRKGGITFLSLSETAGGDSCLSFRAPDKSTTLSIALLDKIDTGMDELRALIVSYEKGIAGPRGYGGKVTCLSLDTARGTMRAHVHLGEDDSVFEHTPYEDIPYLLKLCYIDAVEFVKRKTRKKK